MRVITAVNLSITTQCNMKCPDCCAGITQMPKHNRRFYDWKYMETAAFIFKGIHNINITGGEPSIHPEFERWSPKLKSLFQCQVLSIWTNATMARKKKEAFRNYDVIHISHYTADAYEGCPDNTDDIAFIRDYLKGTRVQVNVTKVIHQPNTGGTKMCFRGHLGSVEYVDGMIYPCCASSGLPTKKAIQPTATWREDIQSVHPPCHECVFAER